MCIFCIVSEIFNQILVENRKLFLLLFNAPVKSALDEFAAMFGVRKLD